MQVDWAGGTIPYFDPVTGEEYKAYLFVAALPCSNYLYVEACTDMMMENWLLCHVHAFEYYGGVPRLLIPDNTRTATIKNTRYETILNKSYQELADHYDTAIVPARTYHPDDKAAAEGSVRFVSTWITAALRDRKLFSIAEARQAVAEKLEALRGAKPTTVFFVYSHNYPDALAVSNVASLMGAPILYVDNTGNLRDSTAAYLKHLGSVKKAYIISGPGVIRPNADTAIGAFGPVQRIYGADRYETCTRINRTFADVLNGNSLCLACGTNYPDALAGSVFAAKYHAPMVLVRGGLTAEQVAYVKEKAPENVYAFGGTGVLPDSVLEAVKKAAR
jgi:putative cell wall-binding protein